MDTGRNDGNWADNSAAVRAVLAGSNPAEVTSTARRLHATIKSHRSFGQPNGDQETGTSAAEKQPQSAYGMKIAQAALQSVGMSIQDCPGPNMGPPEYALAISIIFTKATEQAIMPGTAPRHVLSTSLLCNSLLHDKRFRLVPMSEASPGDIIIESGGNQAHGYAGIVVNHGRLVSNSSQGVQNDSSLVEIQHSHPETVIFRYMGVQGHRISPFANANFNPNEPRILVGQRGGGQWTAGGAGGAQNGRGQLEIAPSTTVLSGGNRWTGSGTGTNALQVDHDNNPKTTGQGEKPNSPLTQVLQALEAGGQHPTPAQLETIGEACDAWQRYVVSHGVSPFVAGEQIQNIIHNFYNPGSGPNPGSEGVLGFQQGQLAGAGAGGIIAGAIVGVSTSQKTSVWSMGPGPRGDEIEIRLGAILFT